MIWNIKMRSHENRNIFYNLYYNTEKNTITYDNGNCLIIPEYILNAKDQIKKGEGVSVRIAMGKKCNFNCVYCSQHSFREREIEKPWKYTPEELAEQLIKFTEPYKGLINIQYWGGETLLYFNEIKRFTDYFKTHTKNEINYGIVTNGSLLKGDIFKWIVDNNIGVTISHDGPGQHLRGIDIFKDEEILKNVKYLLNKFKNEHRALSVSSVMSTYSKSHKNLIEYLKNILDSDDFTLSESVPIIANDARQRQFALNDEDLLEYSKNLYQTYIKSEIVQYTYMSTLIVQFLKKLKNPIPIDRARCFVTDKDVLTIDTSGNIQVCQNISSDGIHDSGDPYKYGNIFIDKEMPEPSLKALRQRRLGKCKDCFVVAICKGGCPYMLKEYEEYNCKVHFHHYSAILASALSLVTRDTVVDFKPIDIEE